MRCSALGPVILGLGALILTLLCLFAGSSKTFLPDYAIITVNTSQVGDNLLSSEYVKGHAEIASILDSVPAALQADAEALLNRVIHQLGIHDFYSANLMSYCEGYYTPGAIPNATLARSAIHRDFSYCSPRSARFQFDPRAALQRDLDAAGNDWLDAGEGLNWPADVDKGLSAVHIVQRAAFIVYCVSAALAALATLSSIISIFLSGRLSACMNVLLAALAFLVAVIAAALATAIAVVGREAVNHYGEQVGISAQAGRGFLGLAWAAAAAMLICVIWWSVDCCCCGRRGRGGKGARRGEKSGSFDTA